MELTMQASNPSINDVFAIMSALAGAVKQTGDTSLKQLTAQIGARVANINIDTPPEDIRAIIEMLDTCDAAMDRLAKTIDAETVAA
jgi:hypothetical protein